MPNSEITIRTSDPMDIQPGFSLCSAGVAGCPVSSVVIVYILALDIRAGITLAKFAGGLPKVLPSCEINLCKGLSAQRNSNSNNTIRAASRHDSLQCRTPTHAPLHVQQGSCRAVFTSWLLIGKV